MQRSVDSGASAERSDRFAPVEPAVVVDEPVFQRRDYFIFSLLTLVSLIATAGLLYHWFAPQHWQGDSVIAVLFTLQLLYWLLSHHMHWWLLPFMRRPKSIAARPGLKVGVATTFVPGLESLEMLERTVTALVAMQYPHETWVLDEGDDDEVKALCQRLGAKHFTRKHLPQYQTADGEFRARTKHGNYNAWFAEVGYARYEIITGFDPDHVPYPQFLDRVLGFFSDPAVGYVQAPQVYYNKDASFVARGAAEETYVYYSSTQMASYNMSFPIVTGCHHSHRVSALKQVGGFPAHDADDLLITLLYRAAGWSGVYQPEILAKGITPVDWAGYLSQQMRWVQSVLDVKLRVFPKVAGRLPLPTRIMSALHGLFYVHEGVSGLLTVCMLSFMLATGWAPRFLTLEMLVWVMTTFLVLRITDFFGQKFFLNPRREGGVHWRVALLRAAKWPYTLLGIFRAAAGHKREYALTAKLKVSRRPKRMLLVPHLLVVAVLSLAWVIGAALGREHHPLLLAPVAFAILVSLVLMWTDTWSFPDPFEVELWTKEFDRTGV